MSSLATINVNNLKSTKYGSTEVKKIMRGSDKLWPLFPIVLKVGSDYYNVTGIQNNRYVKTKIPKEVCTLVLTKGKWISDIELEDYMHVEIWFTLMATYGGKFVGDEPSNGDGRCFRFINLNNPGSTDEIYLDYMSKNSSGTNLNRISKRVNTGTNYNSNMDFRSTLTSVTYHAKMGCKYDSKWKTFFEISGDDGYYLYQESSGTIYGANGKRTANTKFGIFGYISNASLNRALTFYKVLIYDKDDNLLGNWRWKKVNNEWILYDFDKPMTKIDSHGETAYEDKTMSFDPMINEYFELTSYEAIPNSNEAYGTITNNKTGLTMSGVLIDKSIEVDNGEYANEQTIDGINYKLYGFGVDDGSTSSNITIKGYTKFSLYMDLTLIGYGHDIFILNNQEYSIYDLTQTQDDFGSIIYYIGEFSNINPITGTTLNIMADGPIVLYISA